MKYRIALISDLHIGQGARCEDLYLPSNAGSSVLPARPVLDKDYLVAFRTVAESFRRQHGDLDFLCVTGDISDKARPEEFRLASSSLLTIADALGLREEQILFVPGNHDVNWPVQTLGNDPMYRNLRYHPILEGELFKRRNAQLSCGGNLFAEPYCGIWELERAVVLAFNTAEHDGPQAEVREHYGRVNPAAITHARAYLEKLAATPDKLRVCLIHHHPKLYQELRTNWPDFSALSNAEELLALLDEFRFDLVVHGHRHFPNVSTMAGDNTHPLTIIGCGSFSARLDSSWFGPVTNHFHMVELERVSDPVGGIRSQGYVRSWSYDLKKRGWLESHDRTGIRHVRPFGDHAAYGSLLESVRRAIIRCAANLGACEMDDLFDAEPNLRFAAPEQLHRALTEVCANQSMRLKGEKDGAVSEWAVLPGRDNA